MKKFKITEYKPIMAYWYYEVEAENEEQAIRMIQDGEIECIDFETSDDCDDIFEYNIEKVD